MSRWARRYRAPPPHRSRCPCGGRLNGRTSDAAGFRQTRSRRRSPEQPSRAAAAHAPAPRGHLIATAPRSAASKRTAQAGHRRRRAQRPSELRKGANPRNRRSHAKRHRRRLETWLLRPATVRRVRLPRSRDRSPEWATARPSATTSTRSIGPSGAGISGGRESAAGNSGVRGLLHVVSRRSDGYPNKHDQFRAVWPGTLQVVTSMATRRPGSNGRSAIGRARRSRLFSTRHATNPAWPDVNPFCAQNGLPGAECYSGELDVFEGQGHQQSTFIGTVHRNSCGCYGVANEMRQGVPTVEPA
jgi:hypothetical protein